MSLETGVVAALSKPLMWIFGGLFSFIIVLLGYIWKTQDTKVNGLGENLSNNYYSKEVVDLKFEPLKNSIDKNTVATDNLSHTVQMLALEVAKSERIGTSSKHM